MHIEHLLRDESLGLRLLWADEPQLRQEISGVTVTDLEDPARFVRPAEVVLSGLVWWTQRSGRAKADRFVSALRTAGAAVLLAGEETHGAVPDDLVEACRRHGLPVAAVPAHIMFRAITDTVYLQQWGELSRHHALPENVRATLSRLLAQEADPAALVDAAFAHLDRPVAYVLTPTGRTVAATTASADLATRDAAALIATGTFPAQRSGHNSSGTGARPPFGRASVTLPVQADTDAVSPYERWHLHVPDPDDAPPRMLHEIAEILGRCQEIRARRRADEDRAVRELGTLLTAPDTDKAVLEAALRGCGLPDEGPYHVVVAEVGSGREDSAQGALTEAAAHVPHTGAAAGQLPDGTAFAVIAGAGAVSEALADVWPLLGTCEPSDPLHAGIASPAAAPRNLNGALSEARYALTSARTTAPGASRLTDAASLTGLETLLTGVPAEVRAAFSRTVLGPLLDETNASATALLQTLETFLACDGSWARTAEALHLHVNTVHYRIQRIEHFTGRDLSRLYDRADLWAALLSREEPATNVRRARSSTSRAR
ncbi:PucR family transcriptional regulator [Streptomyces sp. NBC_01361]|uniref:PucR family transcriptional regulator n=1 Tax=Streptomyces sp. NBC_01361 TaxID=2903838 RepID=UPI002E341E65|nr:helix-turn-helix domain-containing protein [Streptomyces sp. NBC_01361]